MADDATSAATQEPTSPRDLSPRGYAFAILALLVCTAVAFSPALRAGLLGWDDEQTIARNPLLNPPGFDAIAFYARHSHMHLYVPATYAAWTLLAFVARGVDGGMSAWPFHLANLSVHLAMVVLAAAVLRLVGLRRSAALLGAALVALHPIQVEAVAWASGFKDVAATLLIFAAALAWATARTRRCVVAWTIGATLCYLVALFAKPTAIVTPLVAWALAVRLGERRRAAALRLLPWLVCALPVAAIGRAVQPPSHGEVVAIHLRPLLALDAIGWYAQKLAWPLNLTVDHGRTPTRVLAGDVSLTPSAIGTVVLAAIAIVAWRTPAARRDVALGATLALLALAPILGFVPFDFQSISGVSEHYAYPAMVGVAVALASLAARLPGPAPVIVAAAFGCVAGPLAFAQAGVWRDDDSLFAQVRRVNPSSWIAASAASVDALDRGDLEAAERNAQRAIDLGPAAPNGWANLGAVQARRGERLAAIGSLARAYELEPDNAVVNMNLGGLFAEQGSLALAMPLLEAAVALDPSSAAARGNLASALLQTDRPQDALRHLDVALRFAPRDAGLHVRRAMALAATGRPGPARRAIDAALAIDPASTGALEMRESLDAPPATRASQ